MGPGGLKVIVNVNGDLLSDHGHIQTLICQGGDDHQ